MKNCSRPIEKQQRACVRRSGETYDSLTFFNLLTGDSMLETVENHLPEYRERVYPPTEVLSMFMAQVLSADRSCQNAVDQAVVIRASHGLVPHSTHTGGYCRARQRLPVKLPRELARHSARLLEQQLTEPYLWQGRGVKMVDGTTVSMPDTPENQEKYPQPNTQEEGIGFPICRMVGMVSMGSGAVVDVAYGPCEGKGSDETTLLRELMHNLQPGDIELADALYPSYFHLCDLKRRGVDGLFEQHGSRRRSTDYRRGVQIGRKDHLIVLKKPKRPDWISEQEYEQVPETLSVREFATGGKNGKTMVTTLLCPKQYSLSSLKRFYWHRWQIELALRNIKSTLGMGILSCKTPEMIEKEIWVYLLAYNLIRILMVQAASLSGCLPHQISFKHTVQIWLARSRDGAARNGAEFEEQLFILIAQQRVGNRPGRIEPRAIKRRPKPFPRLDKPREAARNEVIRHGHGPKN